MQLFLIIKNEKRQFLDLLKYIIIKMHKKEVWKRTRLRNRSSNWLNSGKNASTHNR